jgi:DNA polymerase
MGIQRWVGRHDVVIEDEVAPPAAPPPEADSGAAQLPMIAVEKMDWEALTQAIQTCTACKLHEQRTRAVVGTGNRRAEWMIIGEAPGEQEDLQGEPFVGRAGILLNNILASVGLGRDTVYIANVIKCRPPGNRDPAADEIAACLGYLQRQIALIEPRLILIVGRVAAQTLLQTDQPIGKIRGTVYHYGSGKIPVVVTYHPAYLLRRPGEKAKTWQDLKLALKHFSPTA